MSYEDDFRRSRYIRRIIKDHTPSSILVFDTETQPQPADESGRVEIHKLRLWCGKAARIEGGELSRVKEHQSERASHLWEWIYIRADTKRPLWVFCHNLGFDCTVGGFWHEVEQGNIEFEQLPGSRESGSTKDRERRWRGIAILEDPPLIFKCRIKGTTKTIVLVDTFNWFRQSLADIGEALGKRKMSMPDFFDHNDEWYEYCRNDVDITFDLVVGLISWVEEHKLGRMQFTGPSQAFEAFRRRFLPSSKTLLVHGMKDAIQLERRAYYGGMAQCWYKGVVTCKGETWWQHNQDDKQSAIINGPVTILDSQSFYPSIMSAHPSPVALKGMHLAPGREEIIRLMRVYGVAADVRIDCGPPGYPVRRDELVHYAVGRFRTTLCGPEFQRAWDSGHVKSIYGVAFYRTYPIFKDYVDYFYKLKLQYREKGNRTYELMAKLMLNSLYGKFAQWSQRWQEDENEIAPIPLGYFWVKPASEEKAAMFRSIAWLPQRQMEKEEGRNSIPVISAFVTAYGREQILKWVETAGVENCLYSDTDSLHVTQEGLQRLAAAGEVVEGELGKLRIVKTVQEAEYRGLKNYSLDGREIIAGIKKNAEKISANKYLQPKFERMPSIFDRNFPTDIKVSMVEVMVKDTTPLGKLLPNGRIEPVELHEW